MSECVLQLVTYVVPLPETLLGGASSPVTDKEEGLQRDVKFGRMGDQKRPQLKGEMIPC